MKTITRPLTLSAPCVSIWCTLVFYQWTMCISLIDTAFVVTDHVYQFDTHKVVMFQTPVSYTHLDVYKRQQYTYPVRRV